MRSSRRLRGFSLLELLVTLAILGLAAAVAIPSLAELNGQLTIRAASSTVATILNEARMQALFTRCEIGVKWTSTNGDVTFAVYRDGNGNGVRTADIASGVDRLIKGPFSMRKRFGKISFSFVPGFHALDPSGNPIGDLNDPFRLGASDICSFSPAGSCSPGSIYISDGRGRQEVVRLHPIMSRIQVLEYRGGVKGWERLY